MDNFTKIPNNILDALISYRLPGRRHFAAMLYIIRNTYGWNTERRYVSVSKMAAAMGIRRTAASAVVRDLIKMGLIESDGSRGGRASMIRVLPPEEWETTVSRTVQYPTRDSTAEDTVTVSCTGQSTVSPTGRLTVPRTVHIKDISKDTLNTGIKESIFFSSENDDEWLTIDELRERRRANGETDL